MRVRKVAGFTLIELSVVLVIVAIVTGMGLVATLGALESAKRVATSNRLDAIEKALMAYRLSNERLPCPAQLSLASSHVNYGIAAPDNGTCTASSPAATAATTDGAVVQGAVPVKTLNLPNEFMYDGWGRRILYSVMTIYTEPQIFRYMHTKETCGTKVLASSDTTNTRSSNTVYTLTSFGSNGHGGITATGGSSPINSGSSNAAEGYNCRCDVSGHGYSAAATASTLYTVLQDYSEDSTDSHNTYDDIVRFKERWQLQSQDDYKNFDSFVKVQLSLGYDFISPSTGKLSTYQKQCNLYVDNSSTVSGTATIKYSFIGMSTDNALLFTYSDGQNCQLFSVSGITLTALTAATGYAPNTGTSPYGCPTWNANNATALTDDYLGITNSTSPYLKMWKMSNSQLGPLNITFAKNYSSGSYVDYTPSPQPTKIAISMNARQVALSDGSTYAKIYSRAGSVLTPITAPTGMPAAPTVMAFSKDGQFFVANSTTTLKFWQYATPKTYTAFASDLDLSTVDATYGTYAGFSNINAVAFSPDGQYIAVANSAVLKTHIYDLIRIYKMNGTAAPTISSISGDYTGGYTNTGAITAMAWSPDSSILVAIEASSANSEVRKFVALRKQGTASFKYGVALSGSTSAYVPTALGMYH